MALTPDKPIEPNGPPGGGFQEVKSIDTVAFSADRDGQAQQSILGSTPTIVQFNQEQIDQGGFYDPVTFTWKPEAGIYMLSAQVGIELLDNNMELNIRILKNGVAIYFNNKFATANNQNPTASTIGLTIANGTDEYTVEIEQANTGALSMSSNPSISWFYGYKLGVV